MPYKNEEQRRAMHAKAPEVAARWDDEEKADKWNCKGCKKKLDPESRKSCCGENRCQDCLMGHFEKEHRSDG